MTEQLTLAQLGWDDGWQQVFDQLELPQCVPARVLRRSRAFVWLHCGDGTLRAELAGKMLQDKSAGDAYPIVGDWVALEREAEIVRARLPRRTRFSRKAAGKKTYEQVLVANVDTFLLVSGLDRDFSVRRIERYLTLARESGAASVIVLNKADQCDDVERHRAAVAEVAGDAEIVAISAKRGDIAPLNKYVQSGRTLALLGSSGVGKSTLVNALAGKEVMRTGAVRASDSRGRHTTTHRELLILPGGALVIDTPGLRELQLWGDEASLDEVFPDVVALASQCRFNDCSHSQEPDCAIQAALADETLSATRYQSYLALQEEIAALEARRSARSRKLGRRKR